MSDKKIDHRRFLSGVVAQTPFWQQFADTISEISDVHVVHPRRRLQNIREPEGLERQYLVANLRQLGFDYQSALLTDDDYRRLMHMWSLYLPENGTKEFVNFLGYIKRTRFQIEQLWTKDYKNFLEPYAVPEGQKITEINTGYYPSSHVRLYYDAEQFPIQDFSDVYPLFYKIAPIHLVLERIIGSVYSLPQDVTIVAAGRAISHISGYADEMPDPNGRWNFDLGIAGNFVNHVGAVCNAFDTEGITRELSVVAAGRIFNIIGGTVEITEGDLPWMPPVDGDFSVAVTDLSDPRNLTTNMVLGIV